MPKPTQGSRNPAGKKKAKRRPEPRPVVQTAETVAPAEPVQTELNGNGHAGEPVLQFRPRGREVAASRSTAPRTAGAKTAYQTVDYSYVYTDLRIIGVLVAALLVMLVALTFVIR